MEHNLPARIAFLGASRFGLRCLTQLLDTPRIDVVGVVTAPRDFTISYSPHGVTNVLHADMHDACAQHAIPLLEITGSMKDPALLETVARWRPDLFVVVGWYHMLPATWRALAPAYGLHASLLPDYSGGAPLVWAMINGETHTGITLFRMEDGVDSGPIVGQTATPIHAHDTIATLYARIEELGLTLLTECLPALADGSATLHTQDESKRRLFPQRSPADGVIDWTQPAGRIHDFIRAQTRPYPGAFTPWNGSKLTIWAAQPVMLPTPLPPATLCGVAHAPIIACGDGNGLMLQHIALDGTDIPLASLPTGAA